MNSTMATIHEQGDSAGEEEEVSSKTQRQKNLERCFRMLIQRVIDGDISVTTRDISSVKSLFRS
jgi:hypothetical protein